VGVFERLTARARRVMVLAQEESRLLQHPEIGTEHLLLGIVHVNDGVTGKVLEPYDLSVERVRAAVRTIEPASSAAVDASPPFTLRAKKVFELSLREALHLGHSYIGPEHFLLGLIREGEGKAIQVLRALDVDLAQVRFDILAGIDHREDPAAGPLIGSSRLAACSFCGRRPPETGQLIAGNEAFICERCVKQWAARFMSREGQHEQLIPPSITGPPPVDELSARAAVEAAFAELFTLSDDEQRVDAVEDGFDLGRYLLEAAERRLVAEGAVPSVVVDDVVFVNEGQAAVWFTIWVDGRAVLGRHRGDALLVDRFWKVTRATFCDVLARAGVLCPPTSS